MAVDTVTIAEGVRIPTLGLGTYRIRGDGTAYEAVRTALEIGYRHLDTAAMYGNEEDVGRAVRDSGLDRGEVFVTTKVARAEVSPERAGPAVEASLRRLGLDRIDLMLLHWPTTGGRLGAYEVLLDLVEAGTIRAAGVSNFLVPHLEEIAGAGLPLPAVDQIEVHPFLYGSRRPTIRWCEDHGVVVEAYSPLARTRRLDHPAMVEIAAATGLTPTQVHLRWALEHGFVTIPKSADPGRMRENLLTADVDLDDDHVDRLDDLDEHLVVSWNPEGNP